MLDDDTSFEAQSRGIHLGRYHRHGARRQRRHSAESIRRTIAFGGARAGRSGRGHGGFAVQLPSASLIVDQLRDVARRVEAALAQGATAAVVVQGTDAIEESAFVLDLLLQTDRPVVVTGAMRGPEAAGADGPANLLAAVTVAASSASDIGVVVVLNNTVGNLPIFNGVHP